MDCKQPRRHTNDRVLLPLLRLWLLLCVFGGCDGNISKLDNTRLRRIRRQFIAPDFDRKNVSQRRATLVGKWRLPFTGQYENLLWPRVFRPVESTFSVEPRFQSLFINLFCVSICLTCFWDCNQIKCSNVEYGERP